MVLYWMRARRLHVQCACTWTKGGYPHRSFSLWTELNMYIHCRRMQYDLVVLLHFSATHGPLFVIVFSKEQKKNTEYCTGFFPSISIQIQVRIQSDSILVIFPFTQGRQIYFYVQMYIYTTHTVCIFVHPKIHCFWSPSEDECRCCMYAQWTCQAIYTFT